MSRINNGSPPMGDERMRMTSFYATPTQLDQLANFAQKRGQSKAALLRQLIDECLAA